jgi:RimJ/RimL family protein N-acetyltransferase
MRIEFDFLARRKQHLPQLARWYFDEWGELTQAASVQTVEDRLQEYLNYDRIPLIIIATNAGELAGAVQLKFREMTIYPDKEHWIGGVYVGEKFRGRKLATTLVDRAIVTAQEMGVKELFLQTKRLNGGLYRKLGWKAVDRVVYRGIEVAVMVKKLESYHG